MEHHRKYKNNNNEDTCGINEEAAYIMYRHTNIIVLWTEKA